MDRLERLTKVRILLPRLSDDQMQRISMASRRRQEQQRHRREGQRIRGMNMIDALEDSGRLIITPKQEASEL